MLEEIVTRYYQMRRQWIDGNMDDDVWYDYCASVLFDLMEINKDVLEKLKNI